MLKSHGIDLEIAALEQRIADLPELRADDQDFETRFNEGQSLQRDLIQLYKNIRAAERQEDTEGQAIIARNADTSGWDAELRELHGVASRVSIMDVHGGRQPGDLSCFRVRPGRIPGACPGPEHGGQAGHLSNGVAVAPR